MALSIDPRTQRLIGVGAGLVFAFIGILIGVNTGREHVVPHKKEAVKVDGDKTQIAIDIFRQGGDLPHYRDALNLLGAGLTRAQTSTLKPEQRTFLVDEAKLTPAEIGELEANYFRPIDAVYISNATLFRDAARFLEVSGLSELDQAAFAFDWAMRRVLLYEQKYEAVPPVSILRGGHGNATDRGLVALALLRQFRVDGCLLVAPTMRDAPLIGLLVKKDLYIFDLRVGEPVPGPGGKGIATWNDVVKQPDLLKTSKLTAEQVAALEGRLAAPLESLAPRMAYLESLLQSDDVSGDRLAVFFDAERVRRELQAAGLAKVGFWLPALRLDRDFAAVADGGTDATDPKFPNRMQRFTLNLLPLMPVVRRYQELRIYHDLRSDKGRNKLIELTAALFDKYDLQTRELLVRGKLEALPRRLERIRTVIDEDEFAEGDQQLVKQAAKWRAQVEEAYIAEARHEPDTAAKLHAIWGEDDYLQALLHYDFDEIPRNKKKTILTRLILSAAREPLMARTNWTFASLCQDKAERAAEVGRVQKGAGKETKTNAETVRGSWLNARSAWNKYLDGNNAGATSYLTNLPALSRPITHPVDAEITMTLWEHLQRELHQYASARLEQARALKETGQNPDTMLEQLANDLEQLLENFPLAKLRADAGGSGLLQASDGPFRWSLLMRDWEPNGNLAWLVESVRLARAGK